MLIFPTRVDSFLFSFACINLAPSIVQFEILILWTHCCQPSIFPFYYSLKSFLFFQIYTALGLIWKQDLVIKPYILILLYIIDVFVFILKMTCWFRNKATTHCVTYTVNDSKITGRVESSRTCICLWLIHVGVWQKPTQQCEAVIPQLKINNFFKG